MTYIITIQGERDTYTHKILSARDLTTATPTEVANAYMVHKGSQASQFLFDQILQGKFSVVKK